MGRYTFSLLILLAAIIMSGCASKYPILTSYDLNISSDPDIGENATLFNVQKSMKTTYNLLNESLKSLEYDIEKKIKYCFFEAGKTTATIYTVSFRGSSAIADSYDRHIYNVKVWLSSITDNETQVCVQVIIQEDIFEDSKIQRDKEKIYRSDSAEEEIISEFQKHFSGYFTKSTDKTAEENISSSITGIKLDKAEPIYSYLMHIRNGWMVGLSAGYGIGKSLNTDGNTFLDQGSNAVGIRFGKMINPHILIHAEWDGWVYTEEEISPKTEYSLLNYTLACSYYPGNPETLAGGIYLRGGVGVALTNVVIPDDDNSSDNYESGFGLLIGAGYELRLSRKFALGIGAGYNKLIINGGKYFKSGQFIPFYMDFNYYF